MTASRSDPAWVVVGALAIPALLMVVSAAVTHAPWALAAAGAGVAAVVASVVWALVSNPARRMGFGAVQILCGEPCHAEPRAETDEEGVTPGSHVVRGIFVDSAGGYWGKNSFVVSAWVWERIPAVFSNESHTLCERFTFYVVRRTGAPWVTVLAVLPGWELPDPWSPPPSSGGG